MSWEDLTAPADSGPATELFTPVFSDAAEPTMAVGEQPTAVLADPDSVLDSLFGETQFRTYDGATPAEPLVSDEEPPPKPPMQRSQKILIWSAASLVTILALVALYFLGNRLGSAALTAAEEPIPTATQTPEPEPLAAFGPLPPGVYDWDELLGGECFSSFESAWAETFRVVDCADEHLAQLLRRAEFPEDATAPYPDVAGFQSQLSLLCTDPTVLNYSVAGQVDDVQFSYSFPPTQGEWAKGNRTYFCFVSRASAGPLPGDVAVPPVVEAVTEPDA